jgi:hypothetical protein
MNITLETITPQIAMDMLSFNLNNRPVVQARVDQMVHDLRAGKFTACPSPIAFYTDDSLADGQHRLWGIVESGVAHEFLVLRDLPKDAALNIDTHRPRTLVQNVRILGIESDITNNLVSTARVIAHGERSSKKSPLSFTERLAVVTKHRDAARWALTNGPHGTSAKYFKNSLVWGALGRAFYIERDLTRLAHFAEVLGTGFYNEPTESAAIALRNFIINNNTMLNGTAEWNATFLRAQNAIWYFMRRKSLNSIKTIGSERYPLKEGK